MTKKQFDQEMQYQAMNALSLRMLKEGIITQKEYTRIENGLNDKYQPIFRAK